MRGRWSWILIIANMLVLLALTFIYPHLMVSPGPLVPTHAALTRTCFACHTPLRGASAERCIACHALPDIGLRTTKGVSIKAVSASGTTPLKKSFHQELTEQNCMACHSDHAGPKLTRGSRKPFSHELLRVQTRARCDSCHAAPSNDFHKNLKFGCGQCHRTEGWKPAGFDHALLTEAALGRCETCHKAPTDNLHSQANARCGQCHTTKAWKPATIEHDRLFLLDEDHNVPCATCHKSKQYRQYTCYGCHEHTPANIRRKHIEEGIRNFDNCVDCHRSANGDSEGTDRGED